MKLLSLADAQKLPNEIQAVWMDAYNDATGSEEDRASLATAVLNNKFKQDGESYVPRQKIAVRDTFAFTDADKPRITKDGYLVAMPRVARTGIQLYKGSEVGRADLEVVRVYRPEDQVFDRASIRSFSHKPITNDHPSKPVDASNWKQLSVGMTDADVVRDGEFVRTPMLIMDRPTIGQIKDGKKELSVGYEAELVWGEGKTPTGEMFDATQMYIDVNHIAVVKAARGGTSLRIGDDASATAIKENQMANRKIVVDGLHVELEDRDASIVERTIQKLNDSVADLSGKLKALQDAFGKKEEELEEEKKKKKTEVDAKDAKITTLEQAVKDAEVTPQKLDALVADRGDVIGKAKAILGDKLVIKDKSNSDIRRQVVDAKLGDKAKGWDDNKVSAAFDTMTADVKAADGVTVLAADLSRPGFRPFGDQNTAAYDSYDKKLQNRWQGQQQDQQ